MDSRDMNGQPNQQPDNDDQYLKNPGVPYRLDPEVLAELREVFFPNKAEETKDKPYFFGAQVISMQKQHLNMIFNPADKKAIEYLVCEKSDGFRYLLIVTITGDAILMGRDCVCFKVDIPIEPNYSLITPTVLNNVVEILDGELVIDRVANHGKNNNNSNGHGNGNSGSEVKLRFLVFDALVHMKRNICGEKYEVRLREAEKFLRNNSFALQWSRGREQQKKGQIEIIMKDFIPLHDPASTKEGFMEFFFDTYLPCLNHENDGIIFNDRNAPYAVGRKTEAYIKWKPPHLNTVDFLVRHNETFYSQHPDSKVQVLDLYANGNDKETGRYVPLFFGFTVVSLQEYERIEKAYEERKMNAETYVEGVVAECRLVKTSQQFKPIFRELMAESRDSLNIQQMIMNPSDSIQQKQAISAFKSNTHMNCWEVYKLRIDKDNPNDYVVANSIVNSIKDGITKEALIRKWNEYFNEARKNRRG